ncbi:MAG: hypothetical protein IT365_24245 [Candidatus Hydrogenedentes bacterium]|nr:hypothetical protein [Candidatus Hydrogenedentota bacterium]
MASKMTPSAGPQGGRWSTGLEGTPGKWLVGRRAMWELGRWMVTPGGLPIWGAYAFCLLPLGCLSTPIFPLLVGILGGTVVSQLAANRAGACLLSLPVPSEVMSRVLWFVTVVYFPLVYGTVQLPIRLAVAADGGIELSRVSLIMPDCILAGGVGAAMLLTRPLWHRSPPKDGQPRYQYSLPGMILMGAYMILLPLLIPTLYKEQGTMQRMIYGGSVVIAGVLIVASYRVAGRTASIPWLIPQTAENQATLTLPWMRRDSGRGTISFLDMWLTQLQIWTGYILFMLALYSVVSWVQSEVWAEPSGSSRLLVVPIAVIPLILFFPPYTALGYRVIRCLPLRRWQQVMLVFSFALPLVLPVSVVLLAVGLYSAWPVLDVISFLLAYGASCTLMISLGASFKSLGLAVAGLGSSVLMLYPMIDSPWNSAIYLACAAVFGSVAYVNLYRDLCGDGSLYRKRDDFADWIAGRD